MVLFVILSGISASAQTTSATLDLGGYVKSAELNVDTYVEFAKAIKADGRYEIDSACIPALVFHMRSKDGSALGTAQWAIITQIAKSKGLQHFEIQENYTDEKFMHDCSEKRTR